ncbi:MAG: PAS domain S-box protein [Sneathiella sp.]
MDDLTIARLIYIEGTKNPYPQALLALKEMPHTLRTTISGINAIKEIENEPVDLAFITQTLDDMSGLECVQKISSLYPETATLILISEEQVSLIPKILSIELCSYLIVDAADLYISQISSFVTNLLARQKTLRDLRSAEEALEHQRNNIKAIFDYAPVEIYAKDTQRRYQWVNKQWQTNYSLSNEEARGLTSHDIIKVKIANKSKSNDEKVLETGIPTIETQLIKTDNASLTLRTVRFPIKNSKDEITGIGVVAIDDTEKTQNDAILTSIFEDATIGIVLHAPDGNTRVRVNDAFCDLVGFTREQLLHDSYDKLTHPDDLKSSLSLRKELYDGQRKTISFEKRYTHQKGHVVWGAVSTYVIRDPNGDVLYFVSYIRDVTEYKETQSRLEKWQQRLTLATESSGVGIWEWDLEKQTLFRDKSTLKLYGVDPNENSTDIGKWETALHPEDKEAILEALNRAVIGAEDLNTKFRVVWPTGDVRILRAKAIATRGPDGRAVKMLGVNWDVTDSALLEEQIRQSQKMDAVGQLTGGIAHDFNNLLGIAMGHLELIEDGAAKGSETSRLVKPALHALERGAKLTNKLLSFSGKKATGAVTSQVNTVIKNMQDLITKSLTVSITVNLVLEDNLWLTDVDTGDLEDTILNLALNAKDAMPSGGSLVIETRNKTLDDDYLKLTPANKKGEFVLISVSDSGTGMSKEIQDKLYEPFFTTKKAGKGTGLGLSMVFGFVQRSNGHIIHYSEADIGTTVHIYLPRSKSSEEILRSEYKIAAPLPKGNETILVVDDESSLADLAISHLEQLGYTTFKATNGKQALHLLQEHREINLLFSDVVMPGEFDGYQLVLKACKINKDLKFLLTSGFTSHREKMVHDGSGLIKNLTANILGKPYNRSELANAIRNRLDSN